MGRNVGACSATRVKPETTVPWARDTNYTVEITNTASIRDLPLGRPLIAISLHVHSFSMISSNPTPGASSPTTTQDMKTLAQIQHNSYTTYFDIIHHPLSI